MTRIFYKIILCARQALEFSHGQDPERTFGERGYIRQTALRAMCNWLTAGWLIVDATQCGTKQRGYRGKMDYKGDPLDRIPKPPLLLAVFVWAVIIGMNVIIGVEVYFNR